MHRIREAGVDDALKPIGGWAGIYQSRGFMRLTLATSLLVGALLIIWFGVHRKPEANVSPHVYQLTADHAREWTPIGGRWVFQDGLIENRHSDVRGPKLMSGSEQWGNYSLTADLKFGSERGDMGIIIRARDESVGIDAYNGYYVGLRMGGGLIIGRSNYGWVEARPVDFPGGVQAERWYRMHVVAYRCNIAASIQNLKTGETAWIAFEERKCVETGRIGLRSVDVEGAWRNVAIAPAGWNDYLMLQQHTDSVERPVVLNGPPWWTPWHVGGLFVGLLAVALLTQLSYYRIQLWKTNTIMQERQRLAHEIHDTMAQSFAGLGYHIQGIRSGVVRGGLQESQHVAEQLGVAYQLIRRCHTEASETISMLGTGEPRVQQDLLEALSDAAHRIAAHGIVIATHVKGTTVPLNLRVVDALQHIGKEAIANAVTHSGLTQLDLTVHYHLHMVELSISDNGRGFEYNPLTAGFGILGMQKRARNVGGSLHIVSRPNEGTEVRAVVNLNKVRLLVKLRQRILTGREV
jgi:signal transduction histidine kinase